MIPPVSIRIESPVGPLRLMAKDGVIVGLYFRATDDTLSEIPASSGATGRVLREARRQLGDYFAGNRERFELPLQPEGTPFQRSVWNALLEIPFGTTLSYADIANRLGNPKGLRAVGAANGQNPISIIIPCHRVIGRDGSLTGFGGGLDRKRWLLTHEGVLLDA